MTSKRETLVPFKNHAYSGLGSSLGISRMAPSWLFYILKAYLVCVEHSVIDKAVTGFLGCASFNFEVEDATFLASSIVRICILT